MNGSNRNGHLIGLIHFVICLMFLASVTIAFWQIVFQTPAYIIPFKFKEIGLSIGLGIDSLSSIMLAMITLLGTAISRYSLRYLDGEKRQSYFYCFLLFTLVSVSLLVLSSNLLLFFCAWLFTSYGLHKLLVYYPERPLAVRAARKKFVISRLGDVLLFFGIFLTYHAFGTFEFSQLFATVNSLPVNAPENSILSVIGLLFAVGAMTKSAQFPFHFWLPETMETPTPVSALMHAGIINAGGFLMIRLSPLLKTADLAHFLMIGMGALTAVFGAIVMITQNNIKKKLAYSTISQMGVMMLCCGMGAFSLALFHIVAHSFYKAHAFLSTGVLIEESKKEKYSHGPAPKWFLLVCSVFGLFLIVLGTGFLGGNHLPHFTYLAILFLGVAQTINISWTRITWRNVQLFFQVAAILAVAVFVCGFIEILLFHSISSITPDAWGSQSALNQRYIACIVAYGVFVLGAFLSNELMEPKSAVLKKLYIYFWNESYFRQKTNRWFHFPKRHTAKEAKWKLDQSRRLPFFESSPGYGQTIQGPQDLSQNLKDT